MRFLKISLLTLVSGLLGFVAGYMIFARYGDEYIPLGQIFLGNQVQDGVLNSVLFLKPKILGSAAFLAFAGCVIAILLEGKGSRSSSDKGFYECKWCGFKSPSKHSFCEACGHDNDGMIKEDYRMRAVKRKSEKNG